MYSWFDYDQAYRAWATAEKTHGKTSREAHDAYERALSIRNELLKAGENAKAS